MSFNVIAKSAFILGIFDSDGVTPASVIANASDIVYDNSTSGRGATNVQGALDLLDSALDNLSSDAVDINFDNSTNGMVAIDVQNSIEEVKSEVDAL